MNVGVNYMREHMPSDARIHYAMLDGGGVAPNVVQATAKVRYAVRARDLPGMRPLIERVRKVAAGAAMMTETQVDAKIVSAVSNLLGNAPLEQAMQRQMEHLGPPPFDAADRKYAAEIQATLTQEDIASAYARARSREETCAAVRLCRAIRHQGCPDDGLDGRRRRALGGADGAGASGDARDRHARAFLADHCAGQVRSGKEGMPPR
jgi:metal-dependent amidase/aminoacylase/carboxypeptidase family protein